MGPTNSTPPFDAHMKGVSLFYCDIKKGEVTQKCSVKKKYPLFSKEEGKIKQMDEPLIIIVDLLIKPFGCSIRIMSGTLTCLPTGA